MKTAARKKNMAGLQFWIFFFKLHMNESTEGFCWRGRARPYRVDGRETENAREPTVESLVRRIWRLRSGRPADEFWDTVGTVGKFTPSYKTNWNWMTRQRLSSWSQTETFFLTRAQPALRVHCRHSVHDLCSPPCFMISDYVTLDKYISTVCLSFRVPGNQTHQLCLPVPDCWRNPHSRLCLWLLKKPKTLVCVFDCWRNLNSRPCLFSLQVKLL